jgi:Na+/H+ antiporter NhaC
VAGLIFLSKPGQPAPWSWFRYAALAILVVSVIYAAVLTGVTRRWATGSAPSSPTSNPPVPR